MRDKTSRISKPHNRSFLRATSIKSRILLITLSCILGMCVISSAVSFYLFNNYLQHSLVISTETSLRLLADTVDSSMENIYRLVRFCQTSTDVASYIEANPNPGSVLAVSTYDRIYEEYNNNASSGYVPRLAVVTQSHFLQVVSTSYSSTADLAAEIPQLDFFEELLNDADYNFSPGLIDDPFLRRTHLVLPIIRPITYQYNSVQGGYVFAEVAESLFTDPLTRYTTAPDSYITLRLADHLYLYENGSFSALDTDYRVEKDMSDVAVTSDTQVAQIRTSDGGSYVVVTVPLNMEGCSISQTISTSEINSQRNVFLGIVLGTLVGMIAIGLILMYVMNRMINVPVSRLQDKMKRVSRGDFSRDPSIEWNHELGEIGRGINDLSENVNSLMNHRLADEKQKRDLEYQMLLNQINPHFLYNTLNSIKWMAATQGADGIAEMTIALARLFKSISKGTRLLIPLREELSLVQDYFTIQSYRYGGTITLEIQIDDEALYDIEIIKFTLQPLVENAIFHGIEPKGGTGHIVIRAGYEGADESRVCVSVTDDGVGMSEERIRRILTGQSEEKADFFREIGIYSVHQRLQYEFGEEYGITIDSRAGEYTTMAIHLPGRNDCDEDFDR